MAKAPGEFVMSSHMSFGSDYRADKGIRLQDPPFDAHHEVLTQPAHYAETQAFGSDLREAGIDAFEFLSARDPDGGVNVALIRPAAHATSEIEGVESWQCRTETQQVVFSCRSESRVIHCFRKEDFLGADGQLPQPAQ